MQMGVPYVSMFYVVKKNQIGALNSVCERQTPGMEYSAYFAVINSVKPNGENTWIFPLLSVTTFIFVNVPL